MPIPEIDVLTSHISKIFRVEDVTAGNPKEWVARYRGQLLSEDTAAAYDQLADSVRSYALTPLFRKEEGGKQLIYLVPSPVPARMGSRVIINIILFVLTILSVMLTGMDIPPNAIPAFLLIVNDKLACKAFFLRLSLHYTCFTWEWLGPGGLPGLQNLWRVALRAAVGSTPIHSRLF